jgi:anti-sigma-K factor RskA
MTHVHEDIGAFVLGALDSDAERRVREHLATCSECAAAHADLAGIPALLDLAVVTGATEDEPLPPAIEERLLDRFARERVERPQRRRWRPRIVLGLSSALAGAAVAVAALVVGLNFERDGGRPESQYQLAFQRLGSAPANASARAGLRTSEAGTVVRLWVNNLPTGDVYEVWCDAKGWSASAGTFRVDAKGDAYVILTTAVKRGQYDRIRLVRREHLASGKVVPRDILAAKLS